MLMRRVQVLAGKRMYTLLSSLDEERLKRVSQIIQDTVAQTDPVLDQDERLFLAFAMTASVLDDTTEKLRDLVDRIEE